MRLNIPATVAVATQPPKNVPTTSSVFLTTTNSVSNNNNSNNNNIINGNNVSCTSNNNIINNNKNNNNNSTVAILTTSTTNQQQQPSLTIQVNNNNNNSVASSPTALPMPADYLLNESIINNNNGISVVNCSYVECKNGSVAKSSAVNSSVATRNSSVGISVNSNSSSSVPNVLNSSSKRESAANNLQSYANKNMKNGNKISVANATTTTTIPSRDSVNIISVNSTTTAVQQQQRRTAAITTTTTTTPPSPTNSNNSTSSNGTPTASPSRTFTSTQCQTDDIASVQLRGPSYRAPIVPPMPQSANVAVNSPSITTREQRRRERRERRHQQQQLQQLQHVVGSQLPPPHHHHHHHHQQQQQQQQPQLHQLHPHIPSRRHSERHSLPAPPPSHIGHLHPHAAHFHHTSVPPNATMPAAMAAMLRPMLPDILHSHFPPPYSALGGGGSGHVPSGPPTGPPPRPPPPPPPPSTLLTPVISTLPIPGATTIVGDGRFTIPLPMIRRSPSERSGKGCCGQWFAGPPLRALIAVVALGGVACALGGAALGATGLAGPPSSHFTAALLMIGVGVVLVTVSGAAWRMTAPGGPPCLGLGSSVDLGRCGRRPCSRGGGAPHGLLYPEFQHRPPPPSYQASMQEYRLRLLLLDRDRQNGVVRGNSPPPTYRSHAGSLLRAPLTTTLRGGGGGSIGGSEYSLPPSYRSRNTTPATICTERSIETAPSGRLLANEDIPEPLSAEQLPGYSSLQHLRQLSDLSLQTASTHIPKITSTTSAAGIAATTTTTAATTAPVKHQLRTSAIVEVVAANKTTNNVGNDKISSSPALTSASVSNSSAKGKELVTIVTISQNHSDVLSNEVESNAAGRQQQQLQPPNEQMDILARL